MKIPDERLNTPPRDDKFFTNIKDYVPKKLVDEDTFFQTIEDVEYNELPTNSPNPDSVSTESPEELPKCMSYGGIITFLLCISVAIGLAILIVSK